MTARFGMGYGQTGGGPMGYGQMGCGPQTFGQMPFGQMGYGPQTFGPMPFGQMGYGPQTPGMGTMPFCPSCGVQTGFPTMGMPQFMGGMTPPMGFPGYGPSYPGFTSGFAPGYPGYTPGYPGFAPGYGPTYQTMTVPDDEQIREMIYDSIDADPIVPYDADINVEVTGGLVTLTGTVPNKRIKHAVGDDAWWITGVWDVNNQLQVAGRARGERAPEGTPTTARPKTRRPGGQT